MSGISNSFEAHTATTEKYFASNEDFLLWEAGGAQVITEQMVAYPNLDLSGGDFKDSPTDSLAIFKVPGSASVGVEICLDHADQRLRRSTLRSPWPGGENELNLHLVPSCGMNLLEASVAAATGGYAFNCDGLYALGENATGGEGVPVGPVASLWQSYFGPAGSGGAAHTQLTRIKRGPVGADSASVGALDAEFEIPQVDVVQIPLGPVPEASAVFAGGTGAVHIYGLTSPASL